MSTIDTTFSTFCHISEYGEAGYRNLHRMMAFSAPLNLWAPSSVLLRDACHLTTKQFIKYVDGGLIRVLGREAWLTDRRFRGEHPMGPTAAWVDEIDDALKTILQNDQREPLQHQRVVIAPPETGTAWAQEYLASKPAEVDRWNKLFHSSKARDVLPVGSWESAERHAAEGPEKIAEWILRNAYNHGEAAEFAGAKVPLLLSSVDRRLLKVLGESQGAEPRPKSRVTGGLSASAELGVQLLEVLRQLDIHAGPRSLDKFMKGPGRTNLVEWLDTMCQRYQYTDPSKLDGVVLAELRHELGNAKVPGPLSDLLTHPVIGSIGLVGFVLSAVESIGDTGALSLVGMAAATAPAGAFLGRHLGLANAPYLGNQWPFLYAYRSLARTRRLKKLRYALGEFR